jgi:serine/threonine protein kinase
MTAVHLDENKALALVDGTLHPAERGLVETHLQACDPCRELVSETVKLAESRSDRAVDTERALTDSLMPGAVVGPYRVERPIGSGSAGTVYRAFDTRTQAVVALKHVTDPGLRMRFEREAATLARLQHEAIVRYVGHGNAASGMYLAMEWLEGEDLEQRLQRGPLGWQGARLLGIRVAAALAHAHALGAIHRDLSPRNVFLPGGHIERAKLLDFGLVRVDTAELARTATNAVLGTPLYMSPEQVRDPKNVSARSDLFGLGVLLYEAISGQRPFVADDLFTLWQRIVNQQAPDLRRVSTSPVPERFVRLVEALLAKDPAARPASADEVHAQLLSLGAQAVSVPPVRSQAGVIGIVLGILGILISLGIGGALAYDRYLRPHVQASHESPKLAAPGTFPLSCVEGKATATGSWEGNGPIVKVASNCHIEIRHARLKGTALFDRKESNLELTLEDVVIETTDEMVADEGNLTARVKGSKLTSPKTVFRAGANFDLEIEDSTVESTGALAIRGASHVRGENAKIRGRAGAFGGSDGLLDIHLERSEITSSDGVAIEARGPSEITLVGTKIRGADGISSRNMLRLDASKGTEIIAVGTAVRTETNGNITVRESLLQGDAAVKGETNLKVTLREGGRVVGKRIGIDGGNNFELDADRGAIDGGAGAAIAGRFNAQIASRGGTIKGAPAIRLDYKPMRLELTGTKIEGGQQIGR